MVSSTYCFIEMYKSYESDEWTPPKLIPNRYKRCNDIYLVSNHAVTGMEFEWQHLRNDVNRFHLGN